MIHPFCEDSDPLKLLNLQVVNRFRCTYLLEKKKYWESNLFYYIKTCKFNHHKIILLIGNPESFISIKFLHLQ